MKHLAKKMIAFLMCGTMALAAGCGNNGGSGTSSGSGNAGGPAPSSSGGGGKVVGVILNHTQDVFMKNVERGVKEAAEKYPDLDIKIVESGQDPAKQLSQVEEFISEKVDIIALNPTNQEASATAIDEAEKAGIPIFTFNTTSTDEAQAKCVTYVGSDAIESGRIQGRYVAEEILHGKGKIAYIQGIVGHQAQIDREKGLQEILADYPDIQIVLDGAANFMQDEAMQLTENWLQSGTDIDVIVCQGSDMAYGAYLALQDANKVGEIAISAIDMSDDVAKCIADGSIANSVFQDAIGQGKGAVEYADKILKGESVETYIDIPYELVTKDNLSDYDGRY